MFSWINSSGANSFIKVSLNVWMCPVDLHGSYLVLGFGVTVLFQCCVLRYISATKYLLSWTFSSVWFYGSYLHL